MGVSVCLASGKDGVGRSTITVNLGIALSSLGVSTVVVDGDIEGASFSILLGVDPDTPSLHDCLACKTTSENAVIEAHGVNALVGGIGIEQLVDVSVNGFSNILKELTERFDIVLVDSPAGLGTEAVTIMNSCQSVILVLTPDINSVTNTLKTLAVAKKLGTTVLGGIINRTGGQYDIPSDKIEDLLRVKIISEIGEEGLVRQSLQEGVPIYAGNPDSSFSKKIMDVANKLIGSG